MIVDTILAKIFGTKNEREVKALLPKVAAINDLEPAMRQLSDIDLAAKTIEFKEKLAQGATARRPARQRRRTHESRNSARNPSCSKWRSFVSTSERPSRRIVCMEIQSVRLYPLSGRLS